MPNTPPAGTPPAGTPHAGTPHEGPSVPIERLAAALAGAGLLVARRGVVPHTVVGIADDSRRVTPGSLFVAVRGSHQDGHAFLGDAERAGAAAVLVEDPESTALPALVVRDGRRAAAVAAAAFYGDPAAGLTLVGVTGTNGKTTTVGMLRHLLDAPGAPAASVGTLGVLAGSRGEPVPGGAGLTTPGPVELQRLLRVLADRGVRAVAMEVSSHALDQGRTEGVAFAAAVYTNLTRDHLDYHASMEAYFAAKARLADQVASGGAVVVNADDPAWAHLARRARTVTYSAAGLHDADVAAEGCRFDAAGSAFTLRIGGARAAARVPLIGEFNVANAVGAVAAAVALGLPAEEAAERLGTLPQVPGRLERLLDAPAVLRDYAHTPDALERALHAVRPFARGRLVVVFGAGGDRDRGKRPEMGRVAEQLADAVVLTSDNPRTEDPERILDDIAAGMRAAPAARIEDRRAAIAHALAGAAPDDLVLLAGKGHETYQIRGTELLPFDEATVVRELAAARRVSNAVSHVAPDAGAGT